MTSTVRDPYATLGVSRTASLLEIARARRRLAKQFHPDLGVRSDDALARMQAINAAWEILSDPVARGSWDRAHAGASVSGGTRHSWAYADAAWPASTVRSATRSSAAPPEGVHRGWQDSGWIAALIVLVLVLGVFVAAVATSSPTVEIPAGPAEPWDQGNFPDY